MPLDPTVIVVRKDQIGLGLPDPFAVLAPVGLTYQWVRTALIGEPDPEPVLQRVANGWEFVSPGIHPDLATSSLSDAINNCGLVLMQRPTSEVEFERAKERSLAVARMEKLHQDLKAMGFTIELSSLKLQEKDSQA